MKSIVAKYRFIETIVLSTVLLACLLSGCEKQESNEPAKVQSGGAMETANVESGGMLPLSTPRSSPTPKKTTTKNK